MIQSATAGKPTHNEVIKEANPRLAGTIGATLGDSEAERFSEDDSQFLKFHGIYQQDDRDKRKTGKEYIFMVRGRLPGGVVPPDQYLAFDRLARENGNNTLRITTRQGFQFHGVVKSRLGPLMKGINESLATTLAACGDVNRNVMAPPTPATSPVVEAVQEDARKLSDALLPKTSAYHEIWVEGARLDLGGDKDDGEFVDPLYGKTYLPRKFKVAFAIPPLNDIDLFTNCLGFAAITEGERLLGYNLLAGGGMGKSHGNAQTFPRLADVIGFLAPAQVEAFGKAAVTIHRDFGDRTNRKHARLKYVLEDRGVDWFRQEIEKRAGCKLSPARPFEFSRQGDLFGWYQQSNGKNFLGLFVQSGRIQDEGDVRLKSGLRAVVEKFQTEVRLTPSQNLLLVDVAPAHRSEITETLAAHGVEVENQATPLRRASMACPALPTCGLALAESERIMPDLLGRIERVAEEFDLKNEEIVVRTTGCPNGCARPYMAEIGFVGKGPNRYQLYIGGNESSTRLAWLHQEVVKMDEIEDVVRPLLARFAKEREGKERFGDFCARVLERPAAPSA